MSGFGAHILVYVFSALLPHKEETDRDFYDLLGLSDNDKNAKNNFQKRLIKVDDIKKAYRKKSLRLHPDKIAQRRVSQEAREEAAKEYELVQEAYAVLSDKKLRQRYHVLQCSPTKYRFVMGGSYMNPTALHENMATASMREKSRLVWLCLLFLGCVLLQPILIAVKVNHILLPPTTTGAAAHLQSTSWMVLLIPLWVIHGLYILVITAMAVMIIIQPVDGADDDDNANAGVVTPGASADDDTNQNNTAPKKDNSAATAEKIRNSISILLGLIEQISWFIAELFLAMKWDGQFGEDDEETPYYIVFLPIYFAIFLQWVQHIMTMSHIRKDIDKMVTEKYFREHILKGKNLNDLTQEERTKLEHQYLVVQVPPEVELLFSDNEDDQNQDEELKEIMEKEKVTLTQEHITATNMLRQTRTALLNSVVFGIIFWVLLILKVDGIALQQASWWIIFIPVWIILGGRLCYSMFTCCCYAPEVDLEFDRQEAAEAAQDGDNDAEAGDEASTVKDDEEDEDEEDQNGGDKNSSHENDNKKKESKGDKGASSNENNTAKNNSNNNDSGKNSDVKKRESNDIESNGNNINDSGNNTYTISKEEASKKSIKELKQILRVHKIDTSAGAGFIEKDDFVQRVLQVQEENGGKLFSELKDDNDSASFEYGTFAAQNVTTGNDNGEDINEEDDDDNSFVFDEEEFQAWQSAYAEAESIGMEKRAKAQGTCCFTSFQIMIMCLFVAKLNDAYHYMNNNDEDDEDNGNPGFNAFWILFPILFISGIVFCCCACLIYCSGSVMDKMELNGDNDENHVESVPFDTNDDENPQETAAATANDNNNVFIIDNNESSNPTEIPSPTIMTATASVDGNKDSNGSTNLSTEAPSKPLSVDIEKGGGFASKASFPSDENIHQDDNEDIQNKHSSGVDTATTSTSASTTKKAGGSSVDDSVDIDMYDLD